MSKTTTKHWRCSKQPLFCWAWWRRRAGNLFGSGASLQDQREKKNLKNSDFFLCSHPHTSIISSFNRERGCPTCFVFFWAQKELAAVDWKELCPANFQWPLPTAHSGCSWCRLRDDDSFHCSSTSQPKTQKNPWKTESLPSLLLPLSW